MSARRPRRGSAETNIGDNAGGAVFLVTSASRFVLFYAFATAKTEGTGKDSHNLRTGLIHKANRQTPECGRSTLAQCS